MRYYFIVNPVSGGGRGQKIWKQLEPRLKERGTDFRLIWLSCRGAALKAAARLSALKEPFIAVIIGGDGTISEFLDGLTSFAYLTLCCIPTGSGNDFARGLDLERNPKKALEEILAPKEIRAMKVGCVRTQDQSHPFIVSAGIGFDADVCNGVRRSVIKRLLNNFHIGKLIYLTTALGLLIRMQQYRMTLNCQTKAASDDAVFPLKLQFKHTFFAAVMNLPFEGGGFCFAPDADPEDSFFRLVIAEGLTRRRILRLVPLALRGRHAGREGVHILPCRRLEIQSEHPLCIHTDGEILGFYNYAVFEAFPERLNVIITG